MTEAARLSMLLFSAREIISMHGDHVEYASGKRDKWCDRTRDEIDAYRAEKGWSPDGFGGE